MSISAEMKVFVAGLRNDITWKKLPLEEILDYTFVNNLEEEVLDLAAIVRSDKYGGTIGHLGLIMTAGEFALISGVVNAPFVCEEHPGPVDYLLPTLCTTMQQHTECRLVNNSGSNCCPLLALHYGGTQETTVETRARKW